VVDDFTVIIRIHIGKVMNHDHDYKIIRENTDGIVEVCTICKKKLLTRKGCKGRINNREYLKEHVKDTAQLYGPTHKIFIKHYPERWKQKQREIRERKGIDIE
jgi:hypothetical protein